MLDLLTMNEAAQATALSRDTIKRRLRRGDFPGAIRGKPHGKRPPPWLIPVIDLVAAGLTVSGLDETGDEIEKPEVEVLAVKVARAEATVAARDLHIADLRNELRLLHEQLSTATAALTNAGRADCTCAVGGHVSGHPNPEEESR